MYGFNFALKAWRRGYGIDNDDGPAWSEGAWFVLHCGRPEMIPEGARVIG